MAEYVECEVTALEDDKLLDRFFIRSLTVDKPRILYLQVSRLVF